MADQGSAGAELEMDEKSISQLHGLIDMDHYSYVYAQAQAFLNKKGRGYRDYYKKEKEREKFK